MILRRLIDVTKKTSFLRYIWDVLKKSQKTRLFGDVSERSLRCLSQWRSDWDLSETFHAGWDVIEITFLLGCSFVNLLHIFRTVSQKNPLRGLLLNIVTNKRQKGDIKIQYNRNYVYYSLFDVFISFPYRSYWKIQKYKG